MRFSKASHAHRQNNAGMAESWILAAFDLEVFIGLCVQEKEKNQNMLKNSNDASKGIETAKKGVLAIVLF